MQPSITHSVIDGRNVRQMAKDSAEKVVENFGALSKIGINLKEPMVQKMIQGHGMDAIQGTITAATIATPIQFLQAWLPGFVHIITAARKIDEIVGIQTAGSWEDEEAVQGVLELTGNAQPYGDYNNVPLSSWNPSWERRTIVRFEEGLRVGKLEEARAAKMNTNSSANKREAAAVALEIARNRIGFYGFNDGDNRTYGFLNDPSLPAYVNNPGPEWNTATFLQITGDLRSAFSTLRSQSKDTVDPQTTPITLAVASDAVDFLSVVSDYGVSVWDWLQKSYPKTRVVSAPELNDANGGANVFYMFADAIQDNSTDDGRTFAQIVPSKFNVLGVANDTKFYVEDYSNATAGILCKRPYAVVRISGI